MRDNTDRLRTRAVLCHIYHMSLHDKWYEARDLMLMAHLQVSVFNNTSEFQMRYIFPFLHFAYLKLILCDLKNEVGIQGLYV